MIWKLLGVLLVIASAIAKAIGLIDNLLFIFLAGVGVGIIA